MTVTTAGPIAVGRAVRSLLGDRRFDPVPIRRADARRRSKTVESANRLTARELRDKLTPMRNKI